MRIKNWSRYLIILCAVVMCGPAFVNGEGYNSTTADAFWSFEGDQDQGRMAESLAGAGDVNGDGYDDLIVGARYYDAGATDSGIAWVFYGGENGYSATPDVTLNPPLVQTSGFFGFQVAGAGDVNNDGWDDVMVGMMNWDGAPFNHDEGAVFVYHGAQGDLDPTYDWMCRSMTTWAHLGWGMGPAGDVNGDDYDDIIVGGWDPSAEQYQAAMVFHGSATGLDANGTRPIGEPANADWVATSDQAGAGFGVRVGTVGDVHGDGYDDVFVGGYTYDMGQTDEGVMFVWYGSAGGLGPNTTPATADWRAEANQANAQLTGPGESADAGTAGDVNGDGYDDVIVGSWYYDTDNTSDGLTMVFYGSAAGLGDNGTPDNADWTSTGMYEGDLGGGHVACAGDFNGDGLDDVVIGFQGWDDPDGGPENIGLAAIWYGGEDGLPRDGQAYWSDVMIQGEQGGALFARTLAAVGDLNDDGQDDLVVGAWAHDGSHTDAGAVFGFYGAPITFMDDFETGDTLRWSTEVP